MMPASNFRCRCLMQLLSRDRCIDGPCNAMCHVGRLLEHGNVASVQVIDNIILSAFAEGDRHTTTGKALDEVVGQRTRVVL